MVTESEIAVRLTRLRSELAGDIKALRERAAETADLMRLWEAQGGLGRADLVLVAVNLHGWYTALETALERVARLLDRTVPEGSSWHADLLTQMKLDVAGVRAAVIPESSLQHLHSLRKFRHFFRNAYVLVLDPAQVHERASELAQVAGPVAAGLDALQTHVVRTLAELTRAE